MELKGVILPGSSENIGNKESIKRFMTEVIGNTLVERKVVTLNIPEDSEVDDRNFVLDFGKVSSMSIFQKDALKSIVGVDANISENAKTTVYMYKNKKLIKLGKGDSNTLERIIPIVREHIFGGDIEVYRDYRIGCKAVRYDYADIGRMRMNL